MSAKFDEEAHYILVSIMLTRFNCDAHMDGRTEPQQSFYIPSAMCWTGIIASLISGMRLDTLNACNTGHNHQEFL